MVQPNTIHAIVDAIKTHALDYQTWTEAYKATLSDEARRRFEAAQTLMQCVDASYHTPAGTSCHVQAVGMMALLRGLNLDVSTITAAMLYNAVQYADVTMEDVESQVSPEVVALIEGVQTMEALHHVHQSGVAAQSCHAASDTLRRMMLAMVNDVRIVMMKLTEQVCLLRHLKHFSPTLQQTIAHETMLIYAPLANRLGIAQLKWQLEDMAFRFLQPEAYRSISEGLNSKRKTREQYVGQMVAAVTQMLALANITPISCSGRVKHIYSIHRKMEKKAAPLAHIYDTIALRVILKTEADCYDVLSLVHAKWPPIPEEFDDYITHPKPNGYQSIHTAIVGPNGRPVEIQMRTQAMHDAAEFGVASHWLYKEGRDFASYKNKVAWLNQLTTLQHDDATEDPSDYERHTVQLFQDRVFVFTPNGEVKDLPKGATALDFAYAIHTMVGHRCKGVKINDHIATIKTVLQNADRVEILTGPKPQPSQDWLSEEAGYLKTARARSKVSHWFRALHHDAFVEQGKEAFQKAMRRLKLKQKLAVGPCAKHAGFASVTAMYLAIGQGDKHANTLIEQWLHASDATSNAPLTMTPDASRLRSCQSAQPVEAVDCKGLKMHLAHCCHPMPDDAILGWVSRSRGVVVHRKNCQHLQRDRGHDRSRLVEVYWHLHPNDRFKVAIQCLTHDPTHTSLALSQWLNHEKAALYRLNTTVDKQHHTIMHVEVFLSDVPHLNRLLHMLKQLKHVDDAWRV